MKNLVSFLILAFLSTSAIADGPYRNERNAVSTVPGINIGNEAGYYTYGSREGDVFYDLTADAIKLYDGSDWLPVLNLDASDDLALPGDLDITGDITGVVDITATGDVSAGGSVTGDLLVTTPGLELTIATGAVTVTNGIHTVDTEADAASDDLDTISGLTTGGVYCFQAADGARDVVFKDGTGNIVGPGDVTLDNADDVICGISPDGTSFIVTAVSNNGA